MKYFLKSIFVLTLVALLSACNSKQMNEKRETANKIIIQDSWVRAANEGANSAAYLTVFNGTATADTLLGVNTKIAKMAGIHQTYRDNGMAGMKEAGAIIIQPDSSFVLKPGGYHIMLMNLTKTLAKGDSIQITLNFAVTGEKQVMVPIK